MARRGIRVRKRKTPVQKGVTQNYPQKEIVRNNDQLFEYYRRQGIIPEEEWNRFVESLKKDLPTSYRIQGCHRQVDTLVKLMKERFFVPLSECKEEGVEVPEPLPWYPMAYQMSMSRAVVRSHPILKALHNFLVTEVEVGNISRQEAVSMIPALLLDIKSQHNVLDVCAAPGSKTMQIIEMMHNDTNTPEGLVVANDIDNSRCYLLVRQAMKRMPTANCVVINHDASFLPTMMTSPESSAPLLFDRVLCDVICSGDGTFRKNVELWDSWSPQKGIGLHKLQYSIARRAVQLLAVDGLMVYSTCSLNPIEDEAVVAALLRYGAGSLEVVDVSDKLPALKRSRGLNFWKVIDKDMNEYLKYEDVPDKLKRAVVPGMFPPTEEEKVQFNLDRCFRILPHVQNTGGFFVAVIRKTKPLLNSSLGCAGVPPLKRKKCFREQPFVFLGDDDNYRQPLCDYFGLSKDFPWQNLLRRTTETEKNGSLYYVNDSTRRFLLSNQDKIKVINAGLKMFGSVNSKDTAQKFRLSQDGLRTLLPYMSKRLFEVCSDDMCKIMRGHEGREMVPRELVKCDELLKQIDSGSVALFTNINGTMTPISVWFGAHTVAPYVNKEERMHMMRILGYDTSDLEEAMCSKRQSKAIRDRELAAERKESTQRKADEEANSNIDETVKDGFNGDAIPEGCSSIHDRESDDGSKQLAVTE
ncbi:hypothetical protein AB6A40_000094 [Gnathostoma spinigerum]|uniref:tRNA (cytosine(34)-C(5))-methyltransferase n=1 Tax=Gnathostoma spinigerum TaxID=75299 RepID=A0ABD6E1D6_9BILA